MCKALTGRRGQVSHKCRFLRASFTTATAHALPSARARTPRAGRAQRIECSLAPTTPRCRGMAAHFYGSRSVLGSLTPVTVPGSLTPLGTLATPSPGKRRSTRTQAVGIDTDGASRGSQVHAATWHGALRRAPLRNGGVPWPSERGKGPRATLRDPRRVPRAFSPCRIQ